MRCPVHGGFFRRLIPAVLGLRPGLFLIAALLSAGLSVNGWARQVELVVLHTADLQGQLRSMDHREHRQQVGGLLRCATRIQAERDQSANVLLLDSGGFHRGSVESWITDAELVRNAAAWIRFDAMLPDEDWVLSGHRDHPYPGPAVLSNCARPGPTRQRLAGMEPVRWFRLDGIRVAVLAVVDLASGPSGTWSDPFHALREQVRQLHAEEPALTILLYRRPVEEPRHVTLDRVREVVRAFPEIDLVLGSGSSAAVREYRVEGATYAKVRARGRDLGRIECRFDTVRGDWTLVRSDLVAMDSDVHESGPLRQVLGSLLARTEFQLDVVLARNLRDLDGTSRWPGQSGVQHLICHALHVATGADMILIDKQSRAALAEGGVQVGDLFRIAPDRGRWVELRLVASEIRDLLDENVALMGTPAFFGCYGLAYDADPDAPAGRRVSRLRLTDGSALHGRKRWRVLLPADALHSTLEQRPALRRLADLPITRVRLLDVDTQTALVEYVKSVDEIDLPALPGMHLSP